MPVRACSTSPPTARPPPGVAIPTVSPIDNSLSRVAEHAKGAVAGALRLRGSGLTLQVRPASSVHEPLADAVHKHLEAVRVAARLSDRPAVAALAGSAARRHEGFGDRTLCREAAGECERAGGRRIVRVRRQRAENRGGFLSGLSILLDRDDGGTVDAVRAGDALRPLGTHGTRLTLRT